MTKELGIESSKRIEYIDMFEDIIASHGHIKMYLESPSQSQYYVFESPESAMNLFDNVLLRNYTKPPKKGRVSFNIELPLELQHMPYSFIITYDNFKKSIRHSYCALMSSDRRIFAFR